MIRIFLVDDMYLMQEGIKAILKDEPDIEIVGTAKDGQEAISLVTKFNPDIVLLDIEMPKVNGIGVTKYISRFLPKTKVIILSSHRNQTYINQALQAGASSYLLKDSLVEDLKQAIYSLSRGYSYMESQLLNRAVNKIKANNIVNSQKTSIHKQKHPRYPKKSQYLSSSQSIPNKNQTNPPKNSSGISRDSLAPIFESSSKGEIKSANQLSATLKNIYYPSVTTVNQKKRASLLYRKLLWLIMAIATLLLCIFVL